MRIRRVAVNGAEGIGISVAHSASGHDETMDR